MDRNNTDGRYKILIIENNAVFRKGLEQVLNHEHDIMVYGSEENPLKALDLIDETKPDLVIADISLKGSSGIDLVKKIKKRHKTTPVLVLSMHEESLYAKLALRAGASGYVTKQEAPETIICVIHRILRGETYTSKNLTEQIDSSYENL